MVHVMLGHNPVHGFEGEVRQIQIDVINLVKLGEYQIR
jgi:hypothetical protein